MTTRDVVRGLAVLAVLALAGCVGAAQPMGPALAPPSLTTGSVIAADGHVLPMRRWLPDGEAPTAVILALHGFNDYAQAFAEAGPAWAARGIATYAYDQRGFGATARPGIWPGAETLVADAAATTERLRARHPDVPFYLLGESMGGAVAMALVTAPDAPPVDGLILVAPAAWGNDLMPFYQRAALWLTVNTVPGLIVDGGGFDIVPSDNIEMLRALSRDPLVLKENRLDTVAGLVDLMGLGLDSAAALQTPALVLYGDREEVLPPDAVDALLAELPADTARVAFYPDGYHMLLRDLNRAVVLDDIAAWVADPQAPLPSGNDARAAPRLEAARRGG